MRADRQRQWSVLILKHVTQVYTAVPLAVVSGVVDAQLSPQREIAPQSVLGNTVEAVADTGAAGAVEPRRNIHS